MKILFFKGKYYDAIERIKIRGFGLKRGRNEVV